MVHWQTSPDGTNWATQISAPKSIEVTALQFDLGGGRLEAGTTSGEIRFDNFNLPPP